ncbi:C-terminal domain of CHU protein family protein [Arenibacter nanhaiticus]|uniref:C-terminal domain of CHU protein family protein n=1 Tax=Arenibacter nanhaiticus TaxID=558155 RepID=A0A1M6A002_9FLAO|nr:gliding motility-associated C-terminal domain-containing protein [Arenibacter nanhaiticus]SHI29768.1 C-terminal domain of CHU protein family protein [Arenibacter nanhaiticus]
MTPSLKNSLPFLFLCYLFLGAASLFGQTLNKPTPADNPTIAGNSIWTAACASADFNEYYVNFTWLPTVNADNQFILELSDASGNFGSPTELAKVSDKNTNFNFDIKFSLPTDTRGEAYRFRVRSTSPAKISPASDSFEMYYIDFKSSLLISQNANGTIPAGGRIDLCSGNSITLAVHNVSHPGNYQYKWYRSGTLLSEKSSAISIDIPGIYMVEVDYGTSCSGSANTLSNSIKIKKGSSMGIAINPPPKTILCSGESLVLESNIKDQGYTYTWYKNGFPITAPIVDAYNYTVDANSVGFEGEYSVEIDGDRICMERSLGINITLENDFTVALDKTGPLVLLPGKTSLLSATTDANTPTYQWYKDNIAIPGATDKTYLANAIGEYYLEVTQNGGACTSEKISEKILISPPTSFELSIAYAAEYTDCNNTSIVLEVDTITALLPNGTRADVTLDLVNSFTYQWEKDGIPISSETGKNISLTTSEENGNYTLVANLDGYNPTSNTLDVILMTNEALTINAATTVLCNDSSEISIGTATDLNGATFNWLKDGKNLHQTSTVLTVNSPGTYSLELLENGCTLVSNNISIKPMDESLISLNITNNEVVIREGSSKTITARGADSYAWYYQDQTLLSTTDEIELSREGNYTLLATLNGCQISKGFSVSHQDTFSIPNVVTANGDGYNDQWVLPNTYTKDPEINVIIYNHKGEEVFNQFQYNNDWPQATTIFPKQNMVFYYTIQKAKKILKQGTITVIR